MMTLSAGKAYTGLAVSEFAVVRRSFVTSITFRKKKESPPDHGPPLVRTDLNGVATLRMNRPKQLNGWSLEMMEAIKTSFKELSRDAGTKVAILTGTDPYYCAGVNFGSTFRLAHPAKMHKMIFDMNREIFDAFIEFPKPLIVAVNGPAIGACVTSATLADAIVTSEKATFSTPFARLGIVPEGCSSVHFERIMGKDNAERMLGPEGWAPTAAEAKEAGFVLKATRHEDLTKVAQEIAEEWAKTERPKLLGQGKAEVEEYKAVNVRETEALVDALLSAEFLKKQQQFWSSRGKNEVAALFWALRAFRPLWSLLLPKK